MILCFNARREVRVNNSQVARESVSKFRKKSSGENRSDQTQGGIYYGFRLDES